LRIHRNAVSESSLPISTGFTEVFLDWKIWRNRKDTETDPKKDTDRNTDEEIDTKNAIRDTQRTLSDSHKMSKETYTKTDKDKL
jgi:hypothetical protein